MCSRDIVRAAVQAAALSLLAAAFTPCAQAALPANFAAAIAALSPRPVDVPARELTARAEALAARVPAGEVMMGRGDSMLPLYRDGTMLVIAKQDMNDLRPGMTVVFIGDRGEPAAHVLVEKTPRGWIATGLGNSAPDATRVRYGNYLGTVIAAFTPRAEPVKAAPVFAAE